MPSFQRDREMERFNQAGLNRVMQDHLEKQRKIENLISFLSEDLQQDLEGIKTDLIEVGINPDELVSEGKKMIQELIRSQQYKFSILNK